MEQQQYQSFEPDVGYRPKQVVDYIQSLDRQGQIFAQDEERRAKAAQLSDTNKKINAKSVGQDLITLGKFSETLSQNLVEIQKKKNDEETLAGINSVYMNGTDPTGLAAGEQALKEADSVIKDTASSIETEGGDVFAAQSVRQTSGWYRYGQAIGMVRQGAAMYPAYFDQAKLETSIQITDPDGTTRDVTLATAKDPAEYEAVLAEIRNGFLKNYAGVNPAILDKYLFDAMQTFEGKQYATWSRDRAKAIKDENIDDVINNFGNGAIDINEGYDGLIAAGVAPAEARQYLLEQAFAEFAGGNITQEQLDAILDTPYGPGGTWRTGNRRQLADIEQKIRDENLADSRREQREINQAARDDVNEMLELLMTSDSGLSNDQITEQIRLIEEKRIGADPSIYKPLYTYRDNHSQQSRDFAEQQEVVDALYASGELSVAELRSGKYSPEVVTANLGRAQQADQLRQQAGQQAAASANQTRAVQDAVLGPAGVSDVDSTRDPSVSLALDAAQAEQQRLATELKIADPSLSWAQAYQQATLALVSEIKAGVIDPNSKWFITKTKEYAGNPTFLSFTDRNNEAANGQVRANHELLTIRDAGIQQGVESLNPEAEVFTYDEVEYLSNPNNPVTPKLETLVNAINAVPDRPRISIAEARQQLVTGYGFELERPFERDPYEDVAVSPELQALTMKSPAQVARVAEQGALPNLKIRDGVQGAKDVLQVSLSLGVPPQIAPLASAVFANETGWGKYTGGKNNLFAIKSTDGTGTVTMTREGDINQSGGTLERAKFRDYGTRAESVKDFWVFLEEDPRYAAVLKASTPMEALKALKEAGYATNPTYVQDVARTFRSMGIDPNVPYESTQLTESRWSDTRTMSPTAAVYITDNIGPTSTGPHLDVKRVDRGYFDYNDLDGYVMVDDPELGMVPLGELPQTGDWASHTSRGSHGRDYGTYSGTPVYLTNGAKVVSSQRTVHGDLLIIELPNGVQYSLLHGRTA